MPSRIMKNFKTTKATKVTEDEFWYPSQTKSPPHNYSPGIIYLLKDALKAAHQKGSIHRAVLCFEQTVHISRELFDVSWGCGYRNFLMACTALMVQQNQTIYFPLLDDPMPPGARNLQLWIEHAWSQGYDEIGARELDHNLHNTKKYIGTGELYVAFTSRGIPCKLVDFDLDKTYKGINALTEWVVNYFSPPPAKEGSTKVSVGDILRGASPVIATDKMPLILQDDGHSRTIVGYEVAKNGTVSLLAFDPSRKPTKHLRQAGIDGVSSLAHPLSSTSTSRLNRRSNNPPYSVSSPKHIGAAADGDDDDDVIVITDTESEPESQAGRHVKPNSRTDHRSDVLSLCRIWNSKLGRKKKYQILFFTMGNPLTENERESRKIVTSIDGCQW
ncbi:peptidase family C78-domain-containing protein [Hygrophoropsis aurantiaca]|uniref:Peptidase family C78-domain-containing protein n=1 Tax=Hygrophoropsis aurantiaca TaxID=72124 RepID=A0ACB8ANU8_9AGAM|nr:peptidase family C78-domain-containing protein [Hygrophoropsis aurantiaca]